MGRGTFAAAAGGSGQNRKEHSARFHKKTKPQNSNCKAASAALSGFTFQNGVLGWHSHESPSGAFDRPNRSALCADAARRFWAARLEALCLASAAMQRFCDASQFLQNLCFLMSLALWGGCFFAPCRRQGPAAEQVLREERFVWKRSGSTEQDGEFTFWGWCCWPWALP